MESLGTAPLGLYASRTRTEFSIAFGQPENAATRAFYSRSKDLTQWSEPRRVDIMAGENALDVADRAFTGTDPRGSSSSPGPRRWTEFDSGVPGRGRQQSSHLLRHNQGLPVVLATRAALRSQLQRQGSRAAQRQRSLRNPAQRQHDAHAGSARGLLIDTVGAMGTVAGCLHAQIRREARGDRARRRMVDLRYGLTNRQGRTAQNGRLLEV